MKQKIWDLKPDGGGAPVLIEMYSVDAAAAVENHPQRYSREAPEGTVEHEIAAKKRDRDAKLAEVRKQEIEEQAKVNADRRAKVDAIRKEERDAELAEEERLRVEKEEADGKVKSTSRQGEIDQINREAKLATDRIKLDHDRKRDEIINGSDISTRWIGVHEPEPVTQEQFEQTGDIS